FTVMVPAPAQSWSPHSESAAGEMALAGDSEDGTPARVTLRLSEQLKQRIEEAAGRETLSVNAWLVRVITKASSGSPRPAIAPASSGQSFTGWVR
ncbi:MAG: hypothetical protein Q8L05_06360, partial [Actinomycetota bacterium]|nr:hypothetical protein [Actinomycetota bacterium]